MSPRAAEAERKRANRETERVNAAAKQRKFSFDPVNGDTPKVPEALVSKRPPGRPSKHTRAGLEGGAQPPQVAAADAARADASPATTAATAEEAAATAPPEEGSDDPPLAAKRQRIRKGIGATTDARAATGTSDGEYLKDEEKRKYLSTWRQGEEADDKERGIWLEAWHELTAKNQRQAVCKACAHCARGSGGKRGIFKAKLQSIRAHENSDAHRDNLVAFKIYCAAGGEEAEEEEEVEEEEVEETSDLAGVVIIGSVEDERNFSGLNFIKSPQRNRLINPNLCNALRMFLQRQFTVATFPYDGCIHHYKASNPSGTIYHWSPRPNQGAHPSSPPDAAGSSPHRCHRPAAPSTWAPRTVPHTRPCCNAASGPHPAASLPGPRGPAASQGPPPGGCSPPREGAAGGPSLAAR